MKFVNTNNLSTKQKEEINILWNNEYPANLKHNDLKAFELYLSELTEQSHILMIDNANIVKGWYFDFKRDNEKWFAMILDSKLKGKGFGAQLLNKVKRNESELNGWVIDHNNDLKQNGEYYNSPIEFYQKNGFDILSETRLELERISAVKIKWTK